MSNSAWDGAGVPPDPTVPALPNFTGTAPPPSSTETASTTSPSTTAATPGILGPLIDWFKSAGYGVAFTLLLLVGTLGLILPSGPSVQLPDVSGTGKSVASDAEEAAEVA